eukprot:194340-Chlamydomonas_euryale.AAC.5
MGVRTSAGRCAFSGPPPVNVRLEPGACDSRRVTRARLLVLLPRCNRTPSTASTSSPRSARSAPRLRQRLAARRCGPALSTPRGGGGWTGHRRGVCRDSHFHPGQGPGISHAACVASKPGSGVERGRQLRRLAQRFCGSHACRMHAAQGRLGVLWRVAGKHPCAHATRRPRPFCDG